jgi:hypothetical protein
MGRYLTVVLRTQYKNDLFIDQTNQELIERFGAPASTPKGQPFVSTEYVEQQAAFLNTDPEGMRQMLHFHRPIQPDTLSANFFAYRIGECHIQLNYPEKDPSLAAVAISRWITATDGAFIAKNHSFNYTEKILRESLTYAFREWGLDPGQVWKTKTPNNLPTGKKNKKP